MGQATVSTTSSTAVSTAGRATGRATGEVVGRDEPPAVGFPRETTPADRRTLLTPAVAAALSGAGFTVLAEPGIGHGVGIADSALAAEAVQLTDSDRVWGCPLVLRYKCSDPADLHRLRPGQTIGAIFHAEGDPRMLAALAASRVSAYSFEFLRSGAGFPLTRAGGRIAGAQAVLVGAQALQHPRGRGVLISAVPGADPARVVVIGSGNVGRAAAGTAAALGARVTVLARTEASAAACRDALPAGIRVAVNDDDDARRAALAEADLVVGAILVSTFDTPAMITDVDLRRMPPGAVIVDATCGYGAGGYLPTAGPVQSPGDPPRIVHGVLHVKLDALPATVPVTATHAYSSSAAPYLVRLADAVLAGRPDPDVQTARIAHEGHLVHPVCCEHAAFYGVPA